MLGLLWRFAKLLATKNSASRSLLIDPGCLCLPGLLASSLLSLLDVSSAGTAAAQTGLDQPGEDRSGCSNPHECKHFGAQFSANIEFFDRGKCVLHDDKHDSGDDGGDSGEECGQEGEDASEESEPAREYGQRVQEHHDKGQASTCEEETEHPVRDNSDKTEDIGKIRRQCDWRVMLAGTGKHLYDRCRRTSCTSEQLADDDLHRVEPIKSLRL